MKLIMLILVIPNVGDKLILHITPVPCMLDGVIVVEQLFIIFFKVCCKNLERNGKKVS